MKFFIPYSDALFSVPFLEPQPETISMSIQYLQWSVGRVYTYIYMYMCTILYAIILTSLQAWGEVH